MEKTLAHKQIEVWFTMIEYLVWMLTAIVNYTKYFKKVSINYLIFRNKYINVLNILYNNRELYAVKNINDWE
jgi:hypothetical protein